jgi:hypothetical protein
MRFLSRNNGGDREDDEVAESVTYIFAGRRKQHDI